MRINEQYSIKRLDAYNIAVVEHRVRQEGKNAGEEYESTVSYHSTLDRACMRILRMNIDTENMNTILDSIENTKQEILQAVKNVSL